ncbi:hypothetical protein [Curtobacterium sp. MCPF17_052]|uniref:hypothetical protein n=1 Tax=Curtobacterium sp. MCPF17_052 TaxID=2175655 RepID=UPI0024DFC34A|nr:hypothetical protein [Curtobacterium sp. MCPF17_052]WIB12468.1 hypothetical protein DEJ36_17795 [Curtobacterium sp. MCPF17_052]
MRRSPRRRRRRTAGRPAHRLLDARLRHDVGRAPRGRVRRTWHTALTRPGSRTSGASTWPSTSTRT